MKVEVAVLGSPSLTLCNSPDVLRGRKGALKWTIGLPSSCRRAVQVFLTSEDDDDEVMLNVLRCRLT